MTNDLAIRNSTAEFLIFTAQSGEESIEVKYSDKTVWLTQAMIAKLFDKGRSTITEHLTEIFKSEELDEIDFRENIEINSKMQSVLSLFSSTKIFIDEVHVA